MSKLIYLAKNGKIQGPFRNQEIQEFKTNGKYDAFSWIWNSSSETWQAIDPAPKEGPKTARVFEVGDTIDVILHNQVDATSGRLLDPNEFGGSISAPPHADSDIPLFRAGSTVILNLLDYKSSSSENVRAKIRGISKIPDAWIYEFDWIEKPLLIGS